MLRLILALALALLCAAPAAAAAKTFKLGADKPSATIAIPDAWEVDADEGGIEALSPDKALYVSAEMVATADLKEAGEETSKTLAERKIVLKPDTRRQTPLTVSGMRGVAIAWDATDEGGPTQVHMVVLRANADEEVLLLRWGDAATEKTYAAEIDAIVKSIAPIK